MNNTLNLSADKLEAGLIEVIRSISDVTARTGLAFFIVGATARDLVLVYGHGTVVERATRDVDFAVCVESWDQYQELKNLLLDNGYTQDYKQYQRLIHTNGYTIDIIPFGPIEKEGQISWPPDGDFKMCVKGFDEAFRSAMRIKIQPLDIIISVADPAGIALLKLISWQERDPRTRTKDAQDLAYLARHFSRFNFVSATLYEDDIMQRFDWDEDVASGYVLGKETARIASTSNKQRIHRLFELNLQNHGFDRLMEESLENRHPHELTKRKILDAFRKGFIEISKLQPRAQDHLN